MRPVNQRAWSAPRGSCQRAVSPATGRGRASDGESAGTPRRSLLVDRPRVAQVPRRAGGDHFAMGEPGVELGFHQQCPHVAGRAVVDRDVGTAVVLVPEDAQAKGRAAEFDRRRGQAQDQQRGPERGKPRLHVLGQGRRRNGRDHRRRGEEGEQPAVQRVPRQTARLGVIHVCNSSPGPVVRACAGTTPPAACAVRAQARAARMPSAPPPALAAGARNTRPVPAPRPRRRRARPGRAASRASPAASPGIGWSRSWRPPATRDRVRGSSGRQEARAGAAAGTPLRLRGATRRSRPPSRAPARARRRSAQHGAIIAHPAAIAGTVLLGQAAADSTGAGALVNTSSPSAASTRTVSPSANSPSSIASASLSTRRFWITRLSGRAP
jgi:hypothetical protein